MSFDKTKALRNAERFLAQGKIKSAIGEYQQVVINDPKDFGTLNMLGDLYVKNSQEVEAIKCYTTVAEHYAKQGFAQKAIAVYNKISRIEPNSMEVSARLAELYKVKGSVAEAKSHYETLAEHYQKSGRRIEAIEVWKQIGQLDPNNTEVYLTLASAYMDENELDSAVDAYTNAGKRLAKKGSHDKAVEAFEKALEINPYDSATLSAFIQSGFAVGKATEAAKRLSSLMEHDPHNREILQLVVSCQIEAGQTAEAEKSVIRLVELEPANYPQLLEIAKSYIKASDMAAAGRILSMASEHMLAAGEADELHEIVQSVLDKNPQELDALRILVRYCSWKKDEAALQDSLERLAAQAGREEAVEDERFALSQLVKLMPQAEEYAERLKEINEKYGYDENDLRDSLYEAPMVEAAVTEVEADDRSFAIVSDEAVDAGDHAAEGSKEFYAAELENGNVEPSIDEVTEAVFVEVMIGASVAAEIGDDSDEALVREVDSIKFYIENGYVDLAAKAINDLESEFGKRPEIQELREHLGSHTGPGSGATEVSAEPAETKPASQADFDTAKAFVLEDLRAEFGLEEPDAAEEGDYDTRYHTAVAYQEMGLLEDAIKEFQEAVSLVSPSDGTRRFFQCSNLLGHCFMSKGMPQLAVTWFLRSLETPGLNDDEKQGIWYELAAAYEADGDMANAGRFFEQVYTENINFRDVGERIKNIAVHH